MGAKSGPNENKWDQVGTKGDSSGTKWGPSGDQLETRGDHVGPSETRRNQVIPRETWWDEARDE